MTVNVLRLFLTVPRIGLQCVFVVFPDHTWFFFLVVFGGGIETLCDAKYTTSFVNVCLASKVQTAVSFILKL